MGITDPTALDGPPEQDEGDVSVWVGVSGCKTGPFLSCGRPKSLMGKFSACGRKYEKA